MSLIFYLSIYLLHIVLLEKSVCLSVMNLSKNVLS